MSRIAVIQTAFPGDVILCTPVFESLKSAGHYVTVVIRPQAEPLLRHNPHIDKLICYDKRGGVSSFIKTVSALKEAECDIALIVQRYFKSALLPVYAGINKRIGYNIAQVKFLYTDEVHYDKDCHCGWHTSSYASMKYRHEVERCLALCDDLSPTLGFSPKIFITDKDRGEANKFLVSNNIDPDNFIVIAPGSIWPTKRWIGFESLIDLVKTETDSDVVLLGSTDDYNLCEGINKSGSAVNLAGKTDLLQSSAIIQMARLAITNDSAPAHIAAAVGTPIIAIFGPTIPQFGFTPYSEQSAIVENKGLYCRPCSSHGPKQCPEKHFRCMKDITPAQVWNHCKRLLL